MCELLALSSSRPVNLTFSLETLAARWGAAGSAHDGWGVAFYQGTDVALFREPAAAADSALVRFLETEGPATHLAISHIRHATQGGESLANTQPFVRELGGRAHVFAHNGDLPGIYSCDALALGSHRPVGQTDSERAFCVLLERLSPGSRHRLLCHASLADLPRSRLGSRSSRHQWQIPKPPRPQLKCRTLLRHVVVPVIVAGLNPAQSVRLNLRARIARDCEGRHVCLGGAPKVPHRKRPALELACGLHSLRNLSDQQPDRLLAQRHTPTHAEQR
jgi:hypothetical protein